MCGLRLRTSKAYLELTEPDMDPVAMAMGVYGGSGSHTKTLPNCILAL